MRTQRGSSIKLRLVIAGIFILIALFKFYANTDKNEITGQNQRVAISEEEEILLGLEAMPAMMNRHHGEHPSREKQQRVDEIGHLLVQIWESKLSSEGRNNPYQFDFHLLKDDQVINAFALPGGQVFITAALFNQLQTEGQLAGVLGHEIGHVFSRHSAQRMAKQQLTQGIVGAAGVAGGDISSAQMAQMVGSMINMKYGRNDEIESDRWSVRLTSAAGYDPRAMIGVLEILERAAGNNRQPEFMSTHPNPENRIGKIEDYIQKLYPQGVPENLVP